MWKKYFNGENITKGYLFEVDIEYPKELHDYHNDLPLAPEKIKPKVEWCSKLQKDYVVKHKGYKPNEKLITTLFDKERYVLFHENLFWYLQQGLILKKIYRVISFDQKPWMEPYIRFNTEKRTGAKNDFEKDFFKLLNNSVFGKTMEDVRNYRDIKLLNNEK